MNKYKITARLLCHDVRLNTYISTFAEAEYEPPETEIRSLLDPAAQKALESYSGEGCRYELFDIKIVQI